MTAFHVAVVSLFAIFISLTQIFAGEADVTDVVAHLSEGGSWRFDVTVRHDDEGWDHYADRWDVVGPDGTILGKRVLAHPHVTE
ncbi:hypothetical protein [Oricola cellulosilytica]|uniref:hypothetical protein n=1 Tax=Oricola cellulosilytica TaxID=1429082 RepID=UPI001CC02AC2|nr:hypothetical protein [Oricola cellulosilytica]